METKDIRNSTYEKLVKKALRGKKIDPTFKAVLPEIFLRRAYELELSEEDFTRELDNFSRSVERIRFADESTFENPNSYGHQDYNRKEICLNRDAYSKMLDRGIPLEDVCEIMFSYLTHEVFHAMECREDGCTGFMYYDAQTGNFYGTSFTEVFTETTANRCSKSRTAYDAQHYRAQTDGYSDITFISNIIAATFGKTEKEILQAAAKGRYGLQECILAGISNEEIARRAINTLNAFELHSDMLHQLNYNRDEISASGIDISFVRAQTLKNIYEISLREMNSQIEETQSITHPVGFIAAHKYRKDKVKCIMQDTMEQYKSYGFISPDEEQYIHDNVNGLALELSHRIIDMDVVQRNAYKFASHDEYAQAFFLAKDNQIRQYTEWYNSKYDLGISRDVHSTRGFTDNLEQDMYVFREDFDSGKQWDNDTIINKMKIQVYKELTTQSKETQDAEQKSNFQKIKNLFNILFNRKKALAPSSYENGNEGTNAYIPNNRLENKLEKYKINTTPTYKPNHSNIGKETSQKHISRKSKDQTDNGGR